MMRFLFALFIIGVVQNTLAAPLSLELVKVEENLPTNDPFTLGPGPNIDVYHVEMGNPNDADATTLSLNLPGNWINNGPISAITFRDNPSLPTVASFTFAETFFVLPAGTAGTELDTFTTDDNSLLRSNYTLPGATALVPAGGSAVVAVLSVEAGTFVNPFLFSGRPVVSGEFERIYIVCTFGCVPEPTSGVLLMLGLTSMALKRRMA